jgi:hypothetical protein
MPSGALNLDVPDPPVRQHLKEEGRSAADTLPAGGIRVSGQKLIAPQWASEAVDSSPWTFTAGARSQTPGTYADSLSSRAQAGAPGAAAPTP